MLSISSIPPLGQAKLFDCNRRSRFMRPANVLSVPIEIIAITVSFFVLSALNRNVIQPIMAQSTPSSFIPIRIHCGGQRFVDPITEHLWLGGNVYNKNRYGRNYDKPCYSNNTAIALPSSTISAPSTIYCGHKFFKVNDDTVQEFQYDVPVPSSTANSNQKYTARLHFAETVCSIRFVDCCLRDFDGGNFITYTYC
jgi:hypothetical protein